MGSIRSPAFGLPFLLFPDFALGLFGLSAGDGMRVRMAGLLAGISGFYIVMAVRHDLERGRHAASHPPAASGRLPVASAPACNGTDFTQ